MKISTILATILILLAACGGPTGSVVADKKVDFVLFAMSQCPYGVMAEKLFEPVAKEFKENINYRIEYIVSENPDGTFNALHGEPEVKGNIVQLCVQQNFKEKFVDFLGCMNKDAQNIPDNWKPCAEELDIDTEKLEECYSGDEGKQLLSASAKKAKEKNVMGSPTIYINEKQYTGGRATKDFKRAICSYLNSHPSCKEIPACSSDIDCPQKENKIAVCKNPDTKEAECIYEDAKPFEVIILSSARCEHCDTSMISQAFSSVPGAVIRELDTEEDEGKKLVNSLGIEKVPVVLMSKNVKETQFWTAQPEELAQILEDKNEWLKFPDFAVGADFFISEQKKQELLKSIGIPGDKPIVDFFVMSYCPYGNLAEDIINNLYSLFGNTVEFRPRYIIYSNYRGGGTDFCIENGELCSMHGVQELNQNIREACVLNKEGFRKWLAFALAMNKECDHTNADSCWQAVAEKQKLDIDYIKDCEKNKGIELMKEDKRISDALSVSGSPTFFINGERYSNTRTPESVKLAICETFSEKPEACNVILEDTASQASSGSC